MNLIRRFKLWREYNYECLHGEREYSPSFVFFIYVVFIEIPVLMGLVFIETLKDGFKMYLCRRKDFKEYLEKKEVI